jgi:hypothetical protein
MNADIHKKYMLIDKKTLIQLFPGLTSETIDDWWRKGLLPAPFRQPGTKTLWWEPEEVKKHLTRYREPVQGKGLL